MGFGNIKGRARVNPSAPRAFGVCDAGGEWRLRSELLPQLEYFGATLKETGYYVCAEHYDKPQDQLRPLILPPDPVPIKIPRSEPFFQDSVLQGFSQYVLFLPPFAIQPESAVLAALVQASGVAIPTFLKDWSSIVVKQNVSQILIPGVNPTRSYMAIYNPSNPELQLSISGPAMWGVRTNLILGPGEALLWSSSMSAVYTGTVNAIGLIPNVPFYAWEAPVTGPQFALVIPFNGPGDLTISPDLAPAIYSVALPSPYNLRVDLPIYDGTWEGPWTIKDTNGIASSNPITVYPPLGTQIDGYGINQPYPINFSYSSVSFVWDPFVGKFILSGF